MTETEKVAFCPWFTVVLAGAVAIVGGRIAGRTVKVNVWFVTIPLFAESVTVIGEPVVSGAVPVRTPVAESRVAQLGKPVAEKEAAGEAVAATVKLPATVARNEALEALVKTGAVPMLRAAELEEAFVPMRLETTTLNWSPFIAVVAFAMVSRAVSTPL